MTPTTQLEVFAAALHHGDHAPNLDASHVHDCAECFVTLMEAERLDNWFSDNGWHVASNLSLPTEAPSRGQATSRAAAESIDNLNDRQRAVWFVIQHFGPIADHELAERYGAGVFGSAGNVLPPQTEQSLRTRRCELVRAGHVVDSGERRKTKAGRDAVVWAARNSESQGQAA